MAAAKKQTKKDLEDKIAELEAKLNQLSDQLTAKPAETKPAEVKAAETKTAPATLQDALENAYMNAAMTDFHQYRAKVTGYTPAPNRYFVRGTAPVGKIPTKNWNDQKATVTGYTQPSEQYFATRPRLAYHPAEKRFGSFSGVAMTVDGLTVQAKPKEVPKLTPQETEKLAKESYASEMKSKGKGSLPKGF